MGRMHADGGGRSTVRAAAICVLALVLLATLAPGLSAGTITAVFLTPASGASLSGVVTVQAEGHDTAPYLRNGYFRLGTHYSTLVAQAPAPGVSSLAFSIDVDTTTEPNGATTLYALFDEGMGYGDSAAAMIPVTIANPPTTDLRVADLRVQQSGAEQRVRFTLVNEGNTQAPSFETRVEYQYNGVWTLVSFTRVPLAAFSTRPVEIAWSGPFLGDFPIRVVADAKGEIAETDEGDNRADALAVWWTSAPAQDLRRPTPPRVG